MRLIVVKILDSELLAIKLLDMDSTHDGDVVDHVIKRWQTALPQLDPGSLHVVGRVLVLAQKLEKSVNESLETHNLSFGQFDILATLRREGPRGGLSPRELLRNVVLSSGAMTARLDRLEEAGLIQRKPDPNDRRMLAIELTERGRELIEAAAATRFNEAKESLPPLNLEEMETLEKLLRRWLKSLSGQNNG